MQPVALGGDVVFPFQQYDPSAITSCAEGWHCTPYQDGTYLHLRSLDLGRIPRPGMPDHLDAKAGLVDYCTEYFRAK